MTRQQMIYAGLLALVGVIAGAQQQGLIPEHYSAWAGLIGTALAGLLQVVKPPVGFLTAKDPDKTVQP
jgi:hypothetical protein